MELAPPTWMTLRYLSSSTTVDDLMADAHAREPDGLRDDDRPHDGGMVAIWAGDAGYESGDTDAPGPRHRLVMANPQWRLEHDL